MVQTKEEIKAYRKDYYQKNKEKNREQVRIYARKYSKRPEVREQRRKHFNEKYQTDEVFRRRILNNIAKYREKCQQQRKLGRPEIIKELCKDYGLSDDVAEAIALDGVLLDKKLGINTNY